MIDFEDEVWFSKGGSVTPIFHYVFNNRLYQLITGEVILFCENFKLLLDNKSLR